MTVLAALQLRPETLHGLRDQAHENLATSVAAQAKAAFTDLEQARPPGLQDTQAAASSQAKLGQPAYPMMLTMDFGDIGPGVAVEHLQRKEVWHVALRARRELLEIQSQLEYSGWKGRVKGSSSFSARLPDPGNRALNEDLLFRQRDADDLFVAPREAAAVRVGRMRPDHHPRVGFVELDRRLRL